MRFSIIVPVYKTEKYLKQCVDSVLNQSFTDFELILIDDGSPDNCGKICDSYAVKDKRVRTVHKLNSGVADTRNIGMREAKGEFLCFLDSDDYWIDNQVLLRIDKILNEKNVDVLQLNYCFYYQDSKNIEIRKVEGVNEDETIDYEQRLYQLIEGNRFTASTWGTVVSKSFIEIHNLYFLNGVKNTEDVDWVVRIFSFHPRFSIVNEPVYVYRKNREGAVTSNVGLNNIEDHVSTVERLLESLKNATQDVVKPLTNYMLYQAIIAIALVNGKRASIFKQEKKAFNVRLKKVCKKYLKKNKKYSKVKIASKIYSIFGYRVMSFVLGVYLSRRGR